jgi:transposase
MSLRSQPIPPVPEATVCVAHAAFRKGNVFMRMRDEIGPIYTDDAFASLFPARGQPAESPWRLALVTIMQYVEGLSDSQTADAVRGRVDWKSPKPSAGYALSLELTDPGFDASVLSEFRTRLITGGAEERLFDLVLERFRERKLLKARGRHRHPQAGTRSNCASSSGVISPGILIFHPMPASSSARSRSWSCSVILAFTGEMALDTGARPRSVSIRVCAWRTSASSMAGDLPFSCALSTASQAVRCTSRYTASEIMDRFGMTSVISIS